MLTFIDLFIVDKQTALVAMDSRMIVKHSIMLADVLTKVNIAANFQPQKIQYDF